MIFKAVIEMPMLTRYKYEKHGKGLRIDRVLSISIPHNYGYIPKTLSEDGDPLDIFVIADSPIYPLSKVEVEVLCAFVCKDDGLEDNKIIASIVPFDSSGYYDQVDKIRDYLLKYKEGFVLTDWVDSDDAKTLIEEARKRYEGS